MAGREDVSAPRRPGVGGSVWFGFLVPPIVWAARFGASYLLVPYACWWGWIPVLHLATLAAMTLVALAGVVSWRAWRRATAPPGAVHGSVRFMSLVGILASGLFLLVIGAEGVANLVMDPCLTATVPIPY